MTVAIAFIACGKSTSKDANGPYLGDEEIRKIPDPPFKTLEAIGVRPRLATAPDIDRFNVRQDGNAIEAVKDAMKAD